MKTMVRYARDIETNSFDWGSLTWYANAAAGNSAEMTVGKCVIKPGAENPPHRHPNCIEVLVVMQGIIDHRIEEGATVRLHAGDCISIPVNLPHNARNVASEDAVLLVTFSSADRQTIGE